MNPIKAVASVFRNYVNFSGRAQRSEFWWFTLFSFVSQIVLLSVFPIIGWIYVLVLFLPSLAVTARRLHDTDRSAWWMLLHLVPALGFIVLMVVFITLLLELDAFNLQYTNPWYVDPWYAEEARWAILGTLFILWIIWIVISIVSEIVLLIFLIMPGTVGPNRYGPNLRQPQQPVAAPPPNPRLILYCSQCGARLQAGARFCVSCGTAV